MKSSMKKLIKILIIDPDYSIRKSFQDYFSLFRNTVVVGCSNFQEAKITISSLVFDWVICELELEPDQELGWEIYNLLNLYQTNSQLILLTKELTFERKIKAKEKGIAIFEKPFDIEEFKRAFPLPEEKLSA